MSSTYSDRRNTSTKSIFSGTSASDGYEFSPSASVICGFTGMILYPCDCMYAETPWLGRKGLSDNPTTAMVLIRDSSSWIGSDGSKEVRLSIRYHSYRRPGAD